MAKKVFKYKGKTEEELKKMGMKEFMELLPANLRRSLARGFTEDQKALLRKLKKKDEVRTHCRDLVILPEMIGKTIQVHNGKSFNKVQIGPEKLGYKLGDFSLTRGQVKHNSPGVGATRSSANVSVK